MEKQHLKRLGYGFSALVMALSTVAWYPTNSVHATSTCTTTTNLAAVISAITTDDQVVCLSGDITLTAIMNIKGNMTIDLQGHNIEQTKAKTKVFSVAADKTLTIIDSVGGGSISDAYGLNNGTGSVVVAGGVYNIDPVADGATLADGAFKYTGTTEGTYHITTELEAELSNGTSIVMPVGSSMEIATYTQDILKDDGETAMLPTVEATNSGVYAVSDGAITVTPAETGIYTYTITDASGALDEVSVVAYEVSDSTINGKVYNVNISDETLDLSETISGSFAAELPAGAEYEITTDGESATLSEAGIVTFVKAGATQFTLTMNDTAAEKTSFVFLVNVYNDEAGVFYSATDTEGVATSAFGTNWASVESDNEDVATATIDDLTGEVTVKTGATVGKATLTFSDFNDAFSKEVTIYTYKIAESYNFELSENAKIVEYDNAEIVTLPEGVNWTITPAFAAGDDAVVSYANGLFVAGEETGSRVATYTITDDDNDDVVVANVDVTFYVSNVNDATEIADQYIETGEDLDLGALYVKKANADSVVAFSLGSSDENVTLDENTGVFNAATSGKRTITVTESTADGAVIAAHDVTVHVYGIDFEPVVIFVGEEAKEITFNSYNSKVTSWIANSSLTITQTGDASFTFSSDKAGVYMIDFNVENQIGSEAEDVAVGVKPGLVAVLNKMAVAENDSEIDINEALEEEDDASFTVTLDDDFTDVYLSYDKTALTVAEDVENAGSYIVTAKDGVKAGDTYDIVVMQKFDEEDDDEEAVYSQTITITIVDSSETPVVETELMVTTTPGADEEGVIEIKTGENLNFAGTVTGTLVVTEDGAEIEVNVEEGAFDFNYEYAEAGEHTFVFAVSEDTEGTKTVTFTVKVTEETPAEEESEITGEGASTIEKLIDAMKNAETLEEFEKAAVDFVKSFDDEETAYAVHDAIIEGKDVQTTLSVSAPKTALEMSDSTAVSEIEKAAAAYGYSADKLAFYDVDMNVYVEGEYAGKLTNLQDSAKVTMSVAFDDVADGYTRHYVVFYYHDGEVYMISSDDITDNGDGTISFASKQFSTYAVSYYDVKNAATATTATTPDTGAATREGASASATAAASVLAMSAIVAIAGAIKFATKRN